MQEAWIEDRTRVSQRRHVVQRVKWIDLGLALWTGLVLVFLFAPLLVVVLFSFNNSPISTLPMKGLTLDWYRQLVTDQAVGTSLKNSLIVGCAAVFFSTTIGVLAAIGISRYTVRLKGFLASLMTAPMVTPRLVLGVALLTFFSFLQVRLTLVTVAIGHIILGIPYVVLIANARLVGFDRSLEEAARDLGAGTWRILREITVPLLTPAIVAGALISFTLSFDEVVITIFTTGNSNTLPMTIWSMLRYGITPEINAIATLTLLVSMTLAAAVEVISRRSGAVTSVGAA